MSEHANFSCASGFPRLFIAIVADAVTADADAGDIHIRGYTDVI